MLAYMLILLTVSMTHGNVPPTCKEFTEITSYRYRGEVVQALHLPVKKSFIGLQMNLKFSKEIGSATLQYTFNNGSIVKIPWNTLDGQQYLVREPTFEVIEGTKYLDFDVVIELWNSSTVKPALNSIHLNWKALCQAATTKTKSTVKLPPFDSTSKLLYDYAQVLKMSLLFFEAQRSGLLPEDNRVPWRGDSCVNDRGAAGEDLTGGYYTNGRSTKYIFPNAAAMTMLAWGLITFEDGYKEAGQLQKAREALHWGCMHLLKCHVEPNILYALVGDPHRESNVDFWSRPENIFNNAGRPAYTLSDECTGEMSAMLEGMGSDVAGEVAAALAASSIALRGYYQDGASGVILDLYQNHAIQLYDLAKKSRGDFYIVDSPKEAEQYMPRSGDEDELVWAAAWLYRATGRQRFWEDTEDMYLNKFKMNETRPNEYTWFDKTLAIRVLLLERFGPYNGEWLAQVRDDVVRMCTDEVSRPDYQTPGGLYLPFIKDEGAGRQGSGQLSAASNMALLCLKVNHNLERRSYNGRENMEYRENQIVEFAVKQVNYALGDTGRSFMVGFGKNWPTQVHHAGASCPSPPATCDRESYDSSLPNPHVLYGALVGGPDENDKYTDVRSNWRQNDVSLMNNAAFQSVVAGLLELHTKNDLPPFAYDESKHCGLTSVNTSKGFTLHSEISKPGDWPWHAAVYENDNFLCAGTLVSQKAVLTAASCVAERSGSLKYLKSELRVIMGKISLNISEQFEQTVVVSQVLVNPAFIHTEGSSMTLSGDLALLQLEQDVELTKNVRHVCPAALDIDIMYNMKGVMPGWLHQTQSTALRSWDLPIIHPHINPDFRNIADFKYFDVYCAVYPHGFSFPTLNIGAGMVLEERNVWTVEGVFSTPVMDIPRISRPGHPPILQYYVFVKVKSHSKWIEEQLRNISQPFSD